MVYPPLTTSSLHGMIAIDMPLAARNRKSMRDLM
jgi:hypothetical protein